MEIRIIEKEEKGKGRGERESYSETQFPCPSLMQLSARDRKLSAETENYQLRQKIIS